MPNSPSAVDIASYKLVLFGYSRFCIGMTENWSYIRACADELSELQGPPATLVSKLMDWWVAGFLNQSHDTFGLTVADLQASYVYQRIAKKVFKTSQYYGRSVCVSMLLTELSRAIADEHINIRKLIRKELM